MVVAVEQAQPERVERVRSPPVGSMLLAERWCVPPRLRTPRPVGRCLPAVSRRAPGQPTAAGRCSLEPVTSSRSAQRRPQAQENPHVAVPTIIRPVLCFTTPL